MGGVSFGFDKLGGKCLLASEFDTKVKGKQLTQEAYKILHPNVEVVGDIHELNENDVPDCDILSFTTPCQSFSVAGNRKGFEDTRGTLVFEALRIAKHKKPKILFMENVKGLVNHDKGNTLEVILSAMNDVGYTVDFEVLNSKYFGVPQNRERVFIIGIRDDLIESEEWIIKDNKIVGKAKKRMQDKIRSFNFEYPEQKEVTTRLVDILETEVDEKYYLSEEKVAKLIPELVGKIKIDNIDTSENTTHLQGIEYSRKTGVGNTKDIASTISASDWRGLNRNQKQTAILDVSQMRREGKIRIYEDYSPTVAARDYKEPRMVAEVRPICQYPQYSIRKLTPRECFRLQGFSDEDFDKLVEKGYSNSQLYKQAGNAVTVNVIEAIGKKILDMGFVKINN